MRDVVFVTCLTQGERSREVFCSVTEESTRCVPCVPCFEQECLSLSLSLSLLFAPSLFPALEPSPSLSLCLAASPALLFDLSLLLSRHFAFRRWRRSILLFKIIDWQPSFTICSGQLADREDSRNVRICLSSDHKTSRAISLLWQQQELRRLILCMRHFC